MYYLSKSAPVIVNKLLLITLLLMTLLMAGITNLLANQFVYNKIYITRTTKIYYNTNTSCFNLVRFEVFFKFCKSTLENLKKYYVQNFIFIPVCYSQLMNAHNLNNFFP